MFAFTNHLEFEKKIVPWQSDSSAVSCYLCSEEFTFLNRRHHCRLCGRIICASCSENIPIKLVGEARELKSCEKCFRTLFKKRFEGILLNTNEKRMQTIYKVKEGICVAIAHFTCIAIAIAYYANYFL